VKKVTKVLFVISYLNKGGAERVLSNMTVNAPENWEIDILVNNDSVIDYQYKGNIISLGFDEVNRTSSVLFQVVVLIKRILKLKSLKRTNNYDACISFMDSANIANILSGNRYCKTILTVHASLKAFSRKKQYKYIVNPLVKLLYNKADKTVAVSEELRRELISDFGVKKDKTKTIINGCETESISKLAEEPLDADFEKLIAEKRVILNVGRLTEQKYQWHLIKSFSEVVKIKPNCMLLIAGTGELECFLKECVEKLNLQKSVVFLGFQNNVYKYMRKSDIFVLSSGWEGFPVSLAEAICLDLPCVASDFRTGCREILSPNLLDHMDKVKGIYYGEYGVITPLCSGKKDDKLEEGEEMLAEALLELLDNSELYNKYKRMSMENKNNLAISKVMKEWESIIA